MNIGIVTTWFERGAGYVSRQYAKVIEKKHKVFIFARGGENYPNHDPNWNWPNVHWSKKVNSTIPTMFDINEFVEWLKLHSITIVIFNEQWWWQPILTCEKMNIKTGAYIDYYTTETVGLFRAYDFLICNTKRHYSVFNDHPQCFYIPWGTDISIFKPAKPYCKHDEITFFHSAGMSPSRKGTDCVIKAFLKIDSGKLLIHSQTDLKSYYPKLEDVISSLQKSGRLKIVQKEIPAPGLYSEGDVYVYPTRLEGIGLTIAEALASGLPVITSNSPPMNEFVNDEGGRLVHIKQFKIRTDGYYWPECEIDIDDLVMNMLYYIKNKDKIDQLKDQALNYALGKLNWEENADILNSILNKITKLDKGLKEIAIDQIVAYEKKRKANFIFYFYNKYPRMFKMLRYLKRKFT